MHQVFDRFIELMLNGDTILEKSNRNHQPTNTDSEIVCMHRELSMLVGHGRLRGFMVPCFACRYFKD